MRHLFSLMFCFWILFSDGRVQFFQAAESYQVLQPIVKTSFGNESKLPGLYFIYLQDREGKRIARFNMRSVSNFGECNATDEP